MKNSSIFEPISEDLVEYNYGGEGQQHCLQCGEVIEEGDLVVLELFKYRENVIAQAWHPLCWKKSETEEDVSE